MSTSHCDVCEHVSLPNSDVHLLVVSAVYKIIFPWPKGLVTSASLHLRSWELTSRIRLQSAHSSHHNEAFPLTTQQITKQCVFVHVGLENITMGCFNLVWI